MVGVVVVRVKVRIRVHNVGGHMYNKVIISISIRQDRDVRHDETRLDKQWASQSQLQARQDKTTQHNATQHNHKT